MKDWKMINGRRKRYQFTRPGRPCKLFSYFKQENKVMVRYLNFSFMGKNLGFPVLKGRMIGR